MSWTESWVRNCWKYCLGLLLVLAYVGMYLFLCPRLELVGLPPRFPVHSLRVCHFSWELYVWYPVSHLEMALRPSVQFVWANRYDVDVDTLAHRAYVKRIWP